MSDLYRGFTSSTIGKRVTRLLGLPSPRGSSGTPTATPRRRHRGRGRPRPLAGSLVGILDSLGIAAVTDTTGDDSFKGLVLDATGLASSDQLVELRDFFTPLLRRLDTCPRVVVIGTPPGSSGRGRVAQRALEGFTRSLGKEIGRGGTVQLVYAWLGAPRVRCTARWPSC